jgi:two-component system sensor histidine kinase HydH
MWRKIVTPTALVSAIWLAVGAATIYYINWAYHSHAQDLEENFIAIQATDSMQDVLWRLQATAMEVAERADSHTRIEITGLEELFTGHLAAAEASSTTPAAQVLVQAIGNQFARYREFIHLRLDSPSATRPESPPPTEIAHIAHKIANACQELLKVHEQLIADSTNFRSRLRVALDQAMILLWIAGPTVGIVWGLWIARRLQHSISQISISLKDAAGGFDQEMGCVEVLPSDDLPALHQQVQLVSTRIKETVDQLQRARREAMLADRLAAVGELAAGVAHELRNPLTAVKLLIQTAVDAMPDQALSEDHMHVVLEQIQRMESTIQGLLDFARPPQIQEVCHDVRDTLNRALNLIEGHAKQQGVIIRADCPATPVLVDGDPEQLHQVFVNLLLNGVEAMADGGSLLVTIRRDHSVPAGCHVEFRDSGPGIPPSIMARLFEPFVTNKERGTGLGLAISRRIVQQHGGKLTAANHHAAGAVFTIELPPSRENQRGRLPQGQVFFDHDHRPDKTEPRD